MTKRKAPERQQISQFRFGDGYESKTKATETAATRVRGQDVDEMLPDVHRLVGIGLAISFPA